MVNVLLYLAIREYVLNTINIDIVVILTLKPIKTREFDCQKVTLLSSRYALRLVTMVIFNYDGYLLLSQYPVVRQKL